jgi:hypothetical protein
MLLTTLLLKRIASLTSSDWQDQRTQKMLLKQLRSSCIVFLIFRLMALIEVDTIRNSKISENYRKNQTDFDLNPALAV